MSCSYWCGGRVALACKSGKRRVHLKETWDRKGRIELLFRTVTISLARKAILGVESRRGKERKGRGEASLCGWGIGICPSLIEITFIDIIFKGSMHLNFQPWKETKTLHEFAFLQGLKHNRTSLLSVSFLYWGQRRETWTKLWGKLSLKNPQNYKICVAL